MLQAKVDDILDRVTDPVPGGVERLGGFLPGKLARPSGQPQHVSFGGMVLAVAPRKFLRHHTASAAFDASPAVEKKHQKTPERDELEAPLRQTIITRHRLVAPRAHRLGALARPHRYLDGLLVGTEPCAVVNESPMRIAVV
jgi:hypothetical protein